jgi:hypothetical protein
MGYTEKLAREKKNDRRKRGLESREKADRGTKEFIE